jgi:hypothetical protein
MYFIWQDYQDSLLIGLRVSLSEQLIPNSNCTVYYVPVEHLVVEVDAASNVATGIADNCL